MKFVFLKYISLVLVLALVSGGLLACNKEEVPVDIDPDVSDSEVDSESAEDSESTEDTDGESDSEDITEEPKSQLYDDVAGKKIYLVTMASIALNAMTEYSYDENGRIISVQLLDS